MNDRITAGARGLDNRRRSDTWLAVAIVATLLFGIAAFVFGSDLLVDVAGEPPTLPGASSPDAEDLVVVVGRTPGGAGEWTNFTRVISYLSSELKRPMSVRYVAHEEMAGEIVRAEEADLAFLCAHMYLDLADAGLVEGVAVPVVDGRAESVMRLVVSQDSTATCFEDLVGGTLAVSDKSSLGGQAYAIWLCGEHGTTPQGHFDEVQVGETMEQNVVAVMEGRADATVVNSVQLSQAHAMSLKTIEESPPFGAPPVCVSTSLEPELVQRIEDALTSFDREGWLSPDTRIDGFISIDEVSYAFGRILAVQCSGHGHLR